MNNSQTNHSEITTALSNQGLVDQPWWVEQWMELINSYRFKKRLERAWIYAREGNVISIKFEGRRVHAQVQGTDDEPYTVKLWLDILDDEDWSYVLEALTEKARWSAQLLAGSMPIDIENAFAACGRRLFPFKLQEIRSECSCPDKANPCKHISAIYFLLGDRFSEDPFVLFQLRGRNRQALLTELVKQRTTILSQKLNSESTELSSPPQVAHITPHPGVENPNLWWSFESTLNTDLVIITPYMEKDSGLDDAGTLPVAEDPKFSGARQLFVEHLEEQGKLLSQAAMIKAMRISE